MHISKRMLGLFILISSVLLLTGCNSSQPSQPPTGTSQVASASQATSPPQAVTILTNTPTATQSPRPTLTFTPAPSSSPTPTRKPIVTISSTATITSTQAGASLVPGFYSGGGCIDFSVVKKTNYGYPWASFTWCVEYVEIHPDGSMIFVLSWMLKDFSQGVTQISKASDANNPNMFVTDNLGNRYNPISVNGDANGSIIMEKGKIYYGSFTFKPPKPGANRFTFHDEDNDKVISNIVLDKPSIYIYKINLKWSPATITYLSDKWTSSQTDQGGFKLTHTKYSNCGITEAEPGDPQGTYINTIDIGTLKYDIYRTQQADFSLREYVLVGGLDEAALVDKPTIQVTIPYDNSAQCLDDVGTVLASVHSPSP